MVLSPEQAAVILNLTPHGVCYLIRAGRLRAVKLGRQYLIDRKDISRIKYGKPGPKGSRKAKKTS